MIYGPGLDKPIFIKSAGYVVYFLEGDDGELRDAVIALEWIGRLPTTKVMLYGAGAMALGVGIGRLWGI